MTELRANLLSIPISRLRTAKPTRFRIAGPQHFFWIDGQMQLRMSCKKRNFLHDVKMDAQSPDLPSESLREPNGAGWRQQQGTRSLAELYGSVQTAAKGPVWRKLLAFLGPGYLVAVGYMDPGNWATSLAGGSRFGYALLTVALLSNLMAIV